jgi:hypothetical protein
MLRRLTGDLARTLPRTSGSEKPDNDANANHDDRDRGDKAGPRKQGGESDGQYDRTNDDNSSWRHVVRLPSVDNVKPG